MIFAVMLCFLNEFFNCFHPQLKWKRDKKFFAKIPVLWIVKDDFNSRDQRPYWFYGTKGIICIKNRIQFRDNCFQSPKMIPQYGCNDLKMICTQAKLIEELNDKK